MSQISRPFQIALVAIVALALVWLVFLRGHSSSGESSSSTASSSAQPATAAQPSAASSSGASSGSSAGSAPYHGSAPGVAGLTRAITKARGAVAQSQREAKAHSGSAASQGSSSGAGTQSSKASAHSGSSAAKAASPSAKSAPGQASSAKAGGAPAQEAAVQAELKDGRTVIILFWNPLGADDRAVHLELHQLQAIDKKLGHEANKKLAVHYALGSEVGQFGSITRSLQVLQTPTMLVIGPSGNAKTLTGLIDAYAIAQAIREARHS